MTFSVAAIINAGSGDGDGDKIAGLLRDRIEDQSRVRVAEPGDDIREWAEAQVRDGVERVVAAGGDGTIAGVAHGLRGTESVLGIVASGTFNNIARSLDIPEDPAAAVDVALGENIGWINAGRIADTFFFEGAGVGLAADLFPVGEAVKEGDFSELMSGASKFMRGTPVLVDCVLEPPDSGLELKLQTLLLTISNTPTIGARLEIAPEADIRQPWMYMSVYRNFTRLEALLHFGLLALKRGGLKHRVKRYPFSRATLRAETPLSVHADTVELGQHREVIVESVPEAVRVAVPG